MSNLQTLDAMAKALAAVGHVTRLRIVLLLREGETSPHRAAKRFEDLPLGSVAYHFRTLRAAGLIVQTRSRRVRGAVEHFYVLTRDGQDILDRLGLGDDGG